MPKPEWNNLLDINNLYRDVFGFIHIPRTSGTFVSSKMGLGFFDRELIRLFDYDWHSTPSEAVRSQRPVWFTIVRNPYHRIISELRFCKKTFDFLIDFTPPKKGHFCKQVDLCMAADCIIRYEKICDINNMITSMGLPKISLSGFRVPKDYSWMSKSEKELIWQVYKDDFKYLGYLK